MSFGILTTEQAKVVHRLVKGRRVLDLGAGDLGIAMKLVELGAFSVTGIDIHDMRAAYDRDYNLRGDKPLSPKIHPVIERIGALAGGQMFGARIAMLSWPSPNHIAGLVEVVREMPYVIYLGKNVRGVDRWGGESTTFCGTEELFEYLRGRDVVAYVPNPLNTLIVYGPRSVERPLYGEEMAALTNMHRRSTWGFAEAEAEAKRLRG